MSKRVFLSSISHSSKLTEPQEEIMGTSDLEPRGDHGNPWFRANQWEVQVATWACDWSEVESGLVGQSPVPVESDSISR